MNPELLWHKPDLFLILAAFLFAAGLFGMIRRRTLIGMLIAGELIFSATLLNVLTVNRFFAPDPAVGQVLALFIMALAAAEVAIALSIIIAVYRNYRSIHSQEPSELKG